MAKPIYAWCVQLKRKITISEAQKISAPTKDSDGYQLEFRCADDGCREQYNPLIVGVNYYKKEGSYKREPYFKRGNHNVFTHIPSCEGHQDITHVTQDPKKRVKVNYAVKTKTFRIIFRYDAPSKDTLSTTKQIHSDSPSDSFNIRHSSTGTGDITRKPSDTHRSNIESIINDFDRLSIEERQLTVVDWHNGNNKFIRLPLSELLQPVSCFNKDSFHNRIFFGKAKVTLMYGTCYSLWFKDNILIKGYNNDIPLKLPVWINKFENKNNHVLDLLQKALKNTPNQLVTLYFIPIGIGEMSNQSPRFLISNNFNHLAVR
ncbi:hypothetical protein AwWohl_01470 [Gammaproteobacteria bacterium]|nr:hypothetical protein AwWohl_01470 [Gammaproteobacteria bacterium]